MTRALVATGWPRCPDCGYDVARKGDKCSVCRECDHVYGGSVAVVVLAVTALLAALLLCAGCASTRPGETTKGGIGGRAGESKWSLGTGGADPSSIDRPAPSDSPTPPATTIRLRWTMPDSVEWRRPGFGRADSAAVARSDMRGEIVWVPRSNPFPPAYRESLLAVTGWRQHGSAVDTTVATPGHGALFVRARNAAGAWPVRSNLTHARTSE